MTLQGAIQILSEHQKWRLGADIPPTDAKQLTEAIDIAIRLMTQLN